MTSPEMHEVYNPKAIDEDFRRRGGTNATLRSYPIKRTRSQSLKPGMVIYRTGGKKWTVMEVVTNRLGKQTEVTIEDYKGTQITLTRAFGYVWAVAL